MPEANKIMSINAKGRIGVKTIRIPAVIDVGEK